LFIDVKSSIQISQFNQMARLLRGGVPVAFEENGGAIMAWRPTHCLICGELDNMVQGKVTGWMKFAGMM